MSNKINRLRIDEDHFVWFGDYRLPVKFVPERNALEFCDNRPWRSSERGTRFIEIPLEELLKLEEEYLTFGSKNHII